MQQFAPAATSPTITPDEIAELLHIKKATFLRYRQKMITAGMPRPVPGPGMVWSRRLFMAWLQKPEGYGGPLPIEDLDQVDQVRQSLEQRIGAHV